MLAMGGGLGKSIEEYLAMTASDPDPSLMAAARSVLWSSMNPTPFYTIVVSMIRHAVGRVSQFCRIHCLQAEAGRFHHIGTTAEYLEVLTHPSSFRRVFDIGTRVSVKQDAP